MPAAIATAAPPLEPADVRSAEQGRVGQRLVAELRRRRLAEQDRAGRFHARRGDGVFLRDVVLVSERCVGRAHARGVYKVLGGEGDAVQEAERPALHHSVFGFLRAFQGEIGHQSDEAVEHRLQLVGARQHGFGEFDRRDFPGRNLAAQRRCRELPELGHFSSPRPARLRISAEAPKVQGAILSQ
jgi:hypothetical protein